MKLLIVTQTVDSADTTLGFFVRWIEELSKEMETVEVICLKGGTYYLPANIRVHSLGKENGRPPLFPRLLYGVRFFSVVWRLRKDYDTVFVHMNQEYILIAGWLWKLLGKKLYLWRNHFSGSWLTSVAVIFCTKVFCTSRASYTAKYRKAIIMPVGVDTKYFHKRNYAERIPRSILSLGRIAETKRINLLIEALGVLIARGVNFSADIYGNALPKDEAYAKQLQTRTKELNLSQCVKFHSGISNKDTPSVYSTHEVFVNLSPSGMFDKTLFEALACGAKVLSTSADFLEIAGRNSYTTANAKDIAQGIETLFIEEQEANHIIEVHSLDELINRLSSVLKS